MATAVMIPKKGKAFVEHHRARIKPLLREPDQESRKFLQNGGDLYHIIHECDPFRHSYPWGAKRDTVARHLEEVARIETYHSWGYYGFFKPSEAEVIQQIPEELLDQVDHYVVCGPEDSADLREQHDIVNQGYHRATTVLYRTKS